MHYIGTSSKQGTRSAPLLVCVLCRFLSPHTVMYPRRPTSYCAYTRAECSTLQLYLQGVQGVTTKIQEGCRDTRDDEVPFLTSMLLQEAGSTTDVYGAGICWSSLNPHRWEDFTTSTLLWSCSNQNHASFEVPAPQVGFL